MNESPRYVATNMAKVLESRGLKQIWIARQIGVSKSLISKVAAGERAVDAETAERISLLVGVPLFLLFELRERSNEISNVEVAAA